MDVLRKRLRPCYSVKQCRLEFTGGRTSRIHADPSLLTSYGKVCLGEHSQTQDVLRRGTPPLPWLLSLYGGSEWGERDSGFYTDEVVLPVEISTLQLHASCLGQSYTSLGRSWGEGSIGPS